VTIDTLMTARLRLRPWRDDPDDLDALARWNADPLVMRHMGRGPMSRDESEAALARYLRHWDEHGFGLWAVEERETGALIGRTGLSYHRAWPDEPEVGWLIDPAWWDRGLATECGAASIDYAFETLGIPRVVSICIPENLASRRVMEKLGLKLVAEQDDPVLGTVLWIHALDR
jgi:RimJ/RimL family protein N-acetyltransferase